MYKELSGLYLCDARGNKFSLEVHERWQNINLQKNQGWTSYLNSSQLEDKIITEFKYYGQGDNRNLSPECTAIGYVIDGISGKIELSMTLPPM
ncbi:MAG: hypothetical protein QXK37_05760 [Candidatus Woesearchaeota archaeon]